MPSAIPPLLGLREARHIRVHHARRHRVHENVARPKAKYFTSLLMAPLVAAYAESPSTADAAASDELHPMLLLTVRIGRSCCTVKNGART